jgi:hypothetical protein
MAMGHRALTCQMSAVTSADMDDRGFMGRNSLDLGAVVCVAGTMMALLLCPASLLVEVEDNKYSGNNITGNSFDRRPGHVCAELIWFTFIAADELVKPLYHSTSQYQCDYEINLRLTY